jgi:hypothetical protein
MPTCLRTMLVWTFGRIESRTAGFVGLFGCSTSTEKRADDAFEAEPLRYWNTTSPGSAICSFSCRPSLALRRSLVRRPRDARLGAQVP